MKIKNTIIDFLGEKPIESFKRLIIFMSLLLIFMSLVTFAVLIIRGTDDDKIFNFFKNNYTDLMFKGLSFSLLPYFTYYFLYPVVTKKKWNKDELLIKYQIIGFSIGMGIGLIEEMNLK